MHNICRIAEDIGPDRRSDESPSNNDTHRPVHENLLSYVGDIKFSTLNLLLTGRASPYLHNTLEYRLSAASLVSQLHLIRPSTHDSGAGKIINLINSK